MRTEEEKKIFAASLAVMAGLYASPRCVTVLRLTNIPEPPEWGERSVCLFGLKNGIEEQAILATLGSFGQIETCELHISAAIVRFTTREAAAAAVAAGAEQLCKGIGMLYNMRPYEQRGWCVSSVYRLLQALLTPSFRPHLWRTGATPRATSRRSSSARTASSGWVARSTRPR